MLGIDHEDAADALLGEGPDDVGGRGVIADGDDVGGHDVADPAAWRLVLNARVGGVLEAPSKLEDRSGTGAVIGKRAGEIGARDDADDAPFGIDDGDGRVP